MTSQITKSHSGHIIKNALRVDGLRPQMELRVDAHLTCWEIDRLVRRDFNLTSVRMFGTCSWGDDRRRSEVREMLMEFVLQGEFFKAESEQYEMTHEIAVPYVVPLRLVSSECNLLYRTFVAADACMARLKCAVIDGKMTREERRYRFVGFIHHYFELKACVFQTGRGQTASELGKLLGVT